MIPSSSVDPSKRLSARLLWITYNSDTSRHGHHNHAHQGQNISEVAAEFAAKHVLTPAMAQKLHSLLREAVSEAAKSSHSHRLWYLCGRCLVAACSQALGVEFGTSMTRWSSSRNSRTIPHLERAKRHPHDKRSARGLSKGWLGG